jgi:hypothetical protein
MSKETVTLIAALISLAGSVTVVLLGTTLALRKERRQLRWSKELDRFFELEELAGELTSEVTSYRYQDFSTLQPKLERLFIFAGRFSRYDEVRRAILDLDNALQRMVIEKANHGNDATKLRSELVLKHFALLYACDKAIDEGSDGNWFSQMFAR